MEEVEETSKNRIPLQVYDVYDFNTTFKSSHWENLACHMRWSWRLRLPSLDSVKWPLQKQCNRVLVRRILYRLTACSLKRPDATMFTGLLHILTFSIQFRVARISTVLNAMNIHGYSWYIQFTTSFMYLFTSTMYTYVYIFSISCNFIAILCKSLRSMPLFAVKFLCSSQIALLHGPPRCAVRFSSLGLRRFRRSWHGFNYFELL